MAETRIDIAKRDIINHFDSLGQTLFNRKEVSEILREHRTYWRLAQATTVDDFISYLCDKSELRRVDLVSEHEYRTLTRFVWRQEPSAYVLAASLRPRSFLSHYSALVIHDLTDQIPKTIYVNQEQAPKSTKSVVLEQQRIDSAFKRKPRVSRLIYRHQDVRIVLLSGMNTGNLGVVEREDPDGKTVPVTSLERTLIDIAVRPHYAGGIHEVGMAFAAARERASINKLVAILSKMPYAYPYHQALGFLVEHAGFRQDAVARLREFRMEYDFYLVHGMEESDYSSTWRLFFPEGF